MSWNGRRGNSNKNVSGSSYDRRARKRWLLGEFGDGVTALCSFDCGTVLTFETLTVDRHPLPGRDGGRYVHGNIRPACMPCNESDGLDHLKEKHEVRSER